MARVARRFDIPAVACVPIEFPAELAVQQQFKKDSDINVIIKNAERGIAPRFMNPNHAHYGDFTKVADLQTMFSTLEKAKEAFLDLPIELRRELDHDFRNLQRITKAQAQQYGLAPKDAEIPVNPKTGLPVPPPAAPATP